MSRIISALLIYLDLSRSRRMMAKLTLAKLRPTMINVRRVKNRIARRQKIKVVGEESELI